MNNYEDLKTCIELLVDLHYLILKNQGDSNEADKIRDKLEDNLIFKKEHEWLKKISVNLHKLSDSIFKLNETNEIFLEENTTSIKPSVILKLIDNEE